MPIAVQCDTCQRRFRAPDNALGKTAACPNCGSQITIKPLGKQQPVTPSTRKRVTEAKQRLSSTKTVLIVLSALVASALLAVVAFLIFSPDEPNPAAAKSLPAQPADPEALTPSESAERVNPNASTVLARESKPKHTEEGLGLPLEQFKRDVPIGESWKVLSDTKREDGTVSFQLISTTMSNVLLIVSGNPNDLREVSISFAATTDQKEADTLARIAVMAYFLAKYSSWTEEELALFWGRLIQVGAGDESEFRVQKNRHEFWIVPMGVKNGTMFMTGVSAKTDSTAPTLQAWLDDHPVPVGAGLNESTVSRGQVINARFSFKGFRHKGGGSFVGEMTNDSNKDLQLASFKLSLYDRKAVLIDTAPIVISHFGAGQTRSFEAYVEGAPGEFFYKIDFENGY